MLEHLYLAGEELKRVDHLIYVSLKYTRTGDVLKSVINRLVSAYEEMVISMLLYLKDQKKISDFPKAPLQQAELIKMHMPNRKDVEEALEFYLFLRKANLSEYTSQNEYRRNVTMTLVVEENDVDVTIDTVMEYYKQTTGFFDNLRDFLKDAQKDS